MVGGGRNRGYFDFACHLIPVVMEEVVMTGMIIALHMTTLASPVVPVAAEILTAEILTSPMAGDKSHSGSDKLFQLIAIVML